MRIKPCGPYVSQNGTDALHFVLMQEVTTLPKRTLIEAIIVAIAEHGSAEMQRSLLNTLLPNYEKVRE